MSPSASSPIRRPTPSTTTCTARSTAGSTRACGRCTRTSGASPVTHADVRRSEAFVNHQLPEEPRAHDSWLETRLADQAIDDRGRMDVGPERFAPRDRPQVLGPDPEAGPPAVDGIDEAEPTTGETGGPPYTPPPPPPPPHHP